MTCLQCALLALIEVFSSLREIVNVLALPTPALAIFICHKIAELEYILLNGYGIVHFPQVAAVGQFFSGPKLNLNSLRVFPLNLNVSTIKMNNTRHHKQHMISFVVH